MDKMKKETEGKEQQILDLKREKRQKESENAEQKDQVTQLQREVKEL